jgi:hypothetical protein
MVTVLDDHGFGSRIIYYEHAGRPGLWPFLWLHHFCAYIGETDLREIGELKVVTGSCA